MTHGQQRGSSHVQGETSRHGRHGAGLRQYGAQIPHVGGHDTQGIGLQQ
jgi:hypothetical protein